MPLCGEAIYLADVRGTKTCLRFPTARLKINLEQRVLAVTRRRDARSVAPQGLERKKGQTRPLVERSGIHHTIEPGSPSACGLVIDYMLPEVCALTPSCKLRGTLEAQRALEL